MPAILDLPNELLYMIFEHLDSPLSGPYYAYINHIRKPQITASMVCKLWREMLLPSIFGELHCRTYCMYSLEVNLALVKKYGHLVKVWNFAFDMPEERLAAEPGDFWIRGAQSGIHDTAMELMSGRYTPRVKKVTVRVGSDTYAGIVNGWHRSDISGSRHPPHAGISIKELRRIAKWSKAIGTVWECLKRNSALTDLVFHEQKSNAWYIFSELYRITSTDDRSVHGDQSKCLDISMETWFRHPNDVQSVVQWKHYLDAQDRQAESSNDGRKRRRIC